MAKILLALIAIMLFAIIIVLLTGPPSPTVLNGPVGELVGELADGLAAVRLSLYELVDEIAVVLFILIVILLLIVLGGF